MKTYLFVILCKNKLFNAIQWMDGWKTSLANYFANFSISKLNEY